MAKLTEAVVKQAVKTGCPPDKVHVMLWEPEIPGFGLKIRRSGSASWLLTYRPKGLGRKATARTLTLGAWPAVSLDAARTAARINHGKIAMGEDPAVALQAARNRDRKLLPAVLDQYESDMTRRGVVNVKMTMSALRRGLAPLFKQEVDTITRAQIVEQIDALEAGEKPGAATALRTHSRTLLEWCVNRGLVPFNPMAGLRRQRATRAERLEAEEKGKALGDAEIARVWATAGRMGPFGGLVRLGILSGMRRSELAGLRWQDVTEDRIVLHAAGTKTGVRHEVPLTTAMKTIISAQMRQAGSDLVFGSMRKPGAKLSGWSKFTATLVKVSKVDLTLHDLRRTCRTLLSRLGVEENVAELAIGHQRADLIRLYNKDNAWPARVKAFEAVSEHVSKVVAGIDDPAAGGDVVQMPKRRRKAA